MPQLHNALARLFADAGLPDGALQIINFSEEDVAQRVEQLIADPLVRVSSCSSVLPDPVSCHHAKLIVARWSTSRGLPTLDASWLRSAGST